MWRVWKVPRILGPQSVALQMLLEVLKTQSYKLDLGHPLQAWQKPAGFDRRLSRYVATPPQFFCWKAQMRVSDGLLLYSTFQSYLTIKNVCNSGSGKNLQVEKTGAWQKSREDGKRARGRFTSTKNELHNKHPHLSLDMSVIFFGTYVYLHLPKSLHCRLDKHTLVPRRHD